MTAAGRSGSLLAALALGAAALAQAGCVTVYTWASLPAEQDQWERPRAVAVSVVGVQYQVRAEYQRSEPRVALLRPLGWLPRADQPVVLTEGPTPPWSGLWREGSSLSLVEEGRVVGRIDLSLFWTLSRPGNVVLRILLLPLVLAVDLLIFPVNIGWAIIILGA